VVDLRRVATDTVAGVALHDGLTAELQDPTVANLAQYVRALTALPALGPAFDATAFFGTQRLHFDRCFKLLGFGVGSRRRCGWFCGSRRGWLASRCRLAGFTFLLAVEEWSFVFPCCRCGLCRRGSGSRRCRGGL